jgi:hypothetical protein
LRFPGFNTEYVEKNHRGHGEVNEEVEIVGGGRPISLWLSVILSVLCVALFGF